MTDVLIRDVPEDQLEIIRAAAAEKGASLQSYLRDVVDARAAYLRRQAAIAETARRLEGRAPLTDGDRAAIREAIDAEHQERAEWLAGDR